jgi:hypothetical protein
MIWVHMLNVQHVNLYFYMVPKSKHSQKQLIHLIVWNTSYGNKVRGKHEVLVLGDSSALPDFVNRAIICG